MSAQFGRKCSVVLASGEKAIDLSALRVTFHVRQHDLQTPNTCVVRIYNAAADTIRKAQAEFTRLVLSAGYQDGPFGVIFDGTIVQTKKGRENATDTCFDIVAADGDEAYNFGVVNGTLAAGVTPNQQIAAIVGAMAQHGVTLGYVPPDLPGEGLPRGKAFFGMAKDALSDIAKTTGTTWSIQNGQVQFLPIGGNLPGPAVVLNSATGMIGIPEQTENGITVRCLINPNLRLGGRIQINNADIQRAQLNPSLSGQLAFDNLQATAPIPDGDGFYTCLVVEHQGDTRGSDWYSDVIAIAWGYGPPNQQMLGRAF